MPCAIHISLKYRKSEKNKHKKYSMLYREKILREAVITFEDLYSILFQSKFFTLNKVAHQRQVFPAIF